jgi:hypothetical protein
MPAFCNGLDPAAAAAPRTVNFPLAKHHQIFRSLENAHLE